MKFPRITAYKSKHGPVTFGITYFARLDSFPAEVSFAVGRYRLDIIGR